MRANLFQCRKQAHGNWRTLNQDPSRHLWCFQDVSKCFPYQFFSEVMNAFSSYKKITLKTTEGSKQQCTIEKTVLVLRHKRFSILYREVFSHPDTQKMNDPKEHIELRCRAPWSSLELVTNPNIFISSITIPKSIKKGWFSSQSKSKWQCP